MISMAPTLPPATLTDEAMKLAAALLQIAVDPVLTRERLEQLNQATQAYRAAMDEHRSVVAQATEVAAAQEAVEQRARDLATGEDALIREQTRLQAASAAIADRDQTLKTKEAAHAQREADLAKRVAELDRRVESYRAALA